MSDLTTLQADLEALPANGTSRQKCRVQHLVDEHPEAEETIRAAILNTRWSARAVSSVLIKNGMQISEGCIAKHRKGECSACRAASAK